MTAGQRRFDAGSRVSVEGGKRKAEVPRGRASRRGRPLLERLESREAPAVGLDPTFGVGGLAKVPLDIARSQTTTAMVVQADGRIVTAGTFEATSGRAIQVSRMLADGSLDPSFSGDGLASLSLTGATGAPIQVNSVVIQPADGKLVVVGTVPGPAGNQDFFVARLNTDGTPDTSFGSSATVLGEFVPGTTNADVATDVAVAADGKIVVVGQSKFPGSRAEMGVARLTTVGGLDTTFDGDGVALIGFGAEGGGETSARAVAIQPLDGKIVVGGTFQTTSSPDFGVARLSATGGLDPTFNGNGRRLIAFDLGASNRDLLADIALRPNGSIVLLGSVDRATSGDSDFGVVQLTSAGAPDGGFGNLAGRPGLSTVDFGQSIALADFARSLQVLGGGELLLGGTVVTTTPGQATFDFGLARLTASGLLDGGFGAGGRTTVGFDSVQVNTDELRAMTVLSDGKILTVGTSSDVTQTGSTVFARLTSSGGLDQSFDGDGKLTRQVTASVSRVEAMARQTDGKILVASTLSLGTRSVMAVSRMNANGTIDTGFGVSGSGVAFATLTDINLADEVSQARALVVQGDGKILVVGSFRALAGTNTAMAVVRLNSDGTLDTSFDTDGRQTLDFDLGGTNNDAALSVAVQSTTNKILLGGVVDTASGSLFALARLNSDGSIDTPFGGGDALVTIPSAGFGFGAITGLALQTDGKIVAVGGVSTTAGGSRDLGVSRFDSEGALDGGFSGDGLQTVSFDLGGNNDEVATSVVLDSQQRIVVGGDADTSASDRDFAVARLLTSGTLDPAFSGDGKQVVAINAGGTNVDQVSALTVLANDGVALLGTASVGSPSGSQIALVRLGADGTPDPTLGAGGTVPFLLGSSFGGTKNDHGAGIALPGGQFLIAGGVSSDLPPGGEFGLLARLSEDPTPPQILGISAVTSPRNQSVVFVDVTFSEDLDATSFTLTDVHLTRNAQAVPLTAPAVIERIGVGLYRIGGLQSFTATDGSYILQIQGNEVLDLAGNVGSGSSQVSFQVDVSGPVVQSVLPVTDPRDVPLDFVDVRFNEAIDTTSLTMADVALTRDFQSVPLSGGLTVTLQDEGTHTYRLTGFTTFTTDAGAYDLTVSGAGVKDALGNFGSGSELVSFVVVDLVGPVVESVASVTPSPRNTPVDFIDVRFDEPIAEPTFTLADLALTRGGQPVTLTGAGAVTLVDGVTNTYRISGLAAFTSTSGSYQLTVNGAGITDLSFNQGSGSQSTSFVVDTTAPAVLDLVDVTPDPRNTAVASIDVRFSKAIDVTSLTLADLTLTRGGAPVALNGSVTVTVVDAVTNTYRITGLSTFTGQDGIHVLSVLGAGVSDTLGNLGSGTQSDTFTVDRTGPVPQDVVDVSPEVRRQSVSSIDVVFSEAITSSSFTAADLSLRRNGVAVTLSGLTFTPQSSTTVRVGGLGSLTLAGGSYEFTVNGSGVTDTLGNSGSGSASDTWTKAFVAGDYDGDGRVDLATYRFDTTANQGQGQGLFEIKRSSDQSTTSRALGAAGEIPLAGDFDGDGKTDIALYNPLGKDPISGFTPVAVWTYIQSSDGVMKQVVFGGGGTLDRPAQGDFDADGKTDIAVFRANSDLTPGAADWFVRPSANVLAGFRVSFGAANGVDLPAVSDYDNDGRDDIVTFRPIPHPQDVAGGVSGTAQWFVLPSKPNDASFSGRQSAFRVIFGAAGNADQPAVADYDGDGRADILAFRSISDLANFASADWFVLQSGFNNESYSNQPLAGGRRITFGIAGTVAAAGDYTGDGKPDLAVFNSTTRQWSIRDFADPGNPTTTTFPATGTNAVPVLAPLYFRLLATGNPTGGSGGNRAAGFASGGPGGRSDAFDFGVLNAANVALAALPAPSVGTNAAGMSARKFSKVALELLDEVLEQLG